MERTNRVIGTRIHLGGETSTWVVISGKDKEDSIELAKELHEELTKAEDAVFKMKQEAVDKESYEAAYVAYFGNRVDKGWESNICNGEKAVPCIDLSYGKTKYHVDSIKFMGLADLIRTAAHSPQSRRSSLDTRVLYRGGE